jgi:hypothetical protein
MQFGKPSTGAFHTGSDRGENMETEEQFKTTLTVKEKKRQ